MFSLVKRKSLDHNSIFYFFLHKKSFPSFFVHCCIVLLSLFTCLSLYFIYYVFSTLVYFKNNYKFFFPSSLKKSFPFSFVHWCIVLSSLFTCLSLYFIYHVCYTLVYFQNNYKMFFLSSLLK